MAEGTKDEEPSAPMETSLGAENAAKTSRGRAQSDTSARASDKKRSWLWWWGPTQSFEAVLALLLALVGALVSWQIMAQQEALEDTRLEQQTVLENTRFVRQTVMDNQEVKPFRDLNLAGASLSGLNLSGATLRGSDLTQANLSLSMLIRTDLIEVDLYQADLYRADLTGAHLTEATLTEADLTEAILAGADLTGADLTGADLTGVRFEREVEGITISGICYDSSTVWPDDYETGEEPECE